MRDGAMVSPTSGGPPEEFTTSDVSEAAFLAAQDVPVLALRTDRRRVTFVFPPTAAPLAVRFWQPGQDLVSARKFHMAVRDLRGLARRALAR